MKKPAATTDDASALERFESLARRLFAVPKKELDEKLATYRRNKVPRKRNNVVAGAVVGHRK